MDASGLGWYVDSTPTVHEEFELGSADTLLLADQTSPAFGKVDLLTVLADEISPQGDDACTAFEGASATGQPNPPEAKADDVM